MIRIKKRTIQKTITVELPPEYIGKEIEILIYSTEEIAEVTGEKIVTHLVSEPTLAQEWNTQEENEAWKDL